MSDIPKIFTQEYYDEKYFAVPKGKKFKRPDGSIDTWSYANPLGEWLGAKGIAKAWKEIFNPETMLDVGCGRGTFVAYARDMGIKAVGFDYSKWAIENRYPRCKQEWLLCHDATKPWPYKDTSFDLLTILDFYEHIYVDDLDLVISEMYRVAKKWVFLEIATVGGGSGSGIHENGYIFKKGDPIPIEREGNAVAGHVTVCTADWWLEKFDRDEWLPRRDMVNWFSSLVDQAIIQNWLLNSVLILERLE
jgi:SAM-dependent methyltransferase